MTVSAEALASLDEHWALSAIGAERVAAAHLQANRLYVRSTLRGLRSVSVEAPGAKDLIERVAFAYEVVASEGIEELVKAPGNRAEPSSRIAEAAAYRAFELLRALPLVERGEPEDIVRHVLRLASLAYCSDLWAEFQGWLRDRDVEPELLEGSGGAWDQRVLRDLGQVWIRLLRKNGWEDLREVAPIVARLRSDQEELSAYDLTCRPGYGLT
jgi:hypothetical protein